MDLARFSALAHRWHDFCSPVDPDRFDRMIARLPIGAEDRVLDLGCGNGAMLARVCRSFGARGEGVEQSLGMMEACRNHPEIEVFSGDANNITLTPGYALGLVVGATHIFGGLEGSLARLAPLLAPGGHALIGQVFWKKPPSEAFLRLLGAPKEVFSDLDGTLQPLDRAGFRFLRAQVSGELEWDAYEGLYHQSMEAWLRDHPDDPDQTAFTQRFLDVRRRYWEGGRDYLGFVLALYRL